MFWHSKRQGLCLVDMIETDVTTWNATLSFVSQASSVIDPILRPREYKSGSAQNRSFRYFLFRVDSPARLPPRIIHFLFPGSRVGESFAPAILAFVSLFYFYETVFRGERGYSFLSYRTTDLRDLFRARGWPSIVHDPVTFSYLSSPVAQTKS